MKPGDHAPGDDDFAEMRKRHILKVLAECGYNKSAAARKLGLTRQTITNCLNRWGYTRGIIKGDPPASKPPKKKKK